MPKYFDASLIVTKKIQARCNLSAEQWQLYTASMWCDAVANALNTTFERAVNNGAVERQVETAMLEVMEKYSEYGTMDSEPQYVLERMLAAVFGADP